MNTATLCARAGLLLPLVLLLGACGLFQDDEDALSPAELTEITAEVQFSKLWSQDAGAGNGDKYTHLTPALLGEQLFVADVKGRVMAMDRGSGDVLWSTDLDERISGGVGAGGDLVLVGGNDGNLYALEAGSGALRWEARVSSEVLAPPLVAGDRVIVQTMDDNLHAFAAADGGSLWMYDNEVPILTLRGTSRPLVMADLVVAGFANGKLAGIDLGSGQVRWEYRVGIPSGESELERMVDIDGDLVRGGDTVFVASFQGRMSAVHGATGVSRWDREGSSYRGFGVGPQNLYIANEADVVEALDRRSSDVVWKQEALRYRRLTAPITLGDHIVVGDFEGYLHVLSYRDGALIGRTQVHGSGIRSRMVVSEDQVLYVLANNGRLAAYRLN